MIFLKHSEKSLARFCSADNATCHKSAAVGQKLKDLKGVIVLKYFHPYTHKLNPVKGQWCILKKSTVNTMYNDTDDMQESIKKMLKNGEAKVVKMTII